ncbi:MAG: DUF58 domain-containing protein [Planctomycetota bacterium]
MLTEELMRDVRKLEIRARRRVDDLLSGQYHSAFKGQGIEFSEVREYQPGDEVRWIDWNVTARAGRPFVKRFVEERQLTVILAVDCGPTSMFGSAAKTKHQLAAEVGACLTLAATRNNDFAGLHLLGADTVLHLPPARGRTHALRVIRELLSAHPAEQPAPLADGLADLNRTLKRPAIVFLISDLLADLPEDDSEPAWAHPVRLMARKHDVIAITPEDPRERALPAMGLLRMADPVTGRRVTVDTSSARVRSRYAAAAARDDRAIEQALSRARVDRVRVSTDRPFADGLARYLRVRERRA